MFGQAGPGQFLEGWIREHFEIMDETLRIHTQKVNEKEFAQPVRVQDPDFGVTLLCDVLIKTSMQSGTSANFLALTRRYPS